MNRLKTPLHDQLVLILFLFESHRRKCPPLLLDIFSPRKLGTLVFFWG